jgi:DNA primase
MPRAQPGQRRDPALVVEREALKCALQEPSVVADWYESVEDTAFTHPTARQVHHAIAGAGYPSTTLSGLLWIDAVLEHSEDDSVRGLVRELAVEPLPATAGQDARYAIGVISRLLELDASRRIDELKGRLQRIDPTAQAAEYQQCFADLLALEEYRRSMKQDLLGGVS